MPKYLIDEILPIHRVHLLGGVSDAGKTRWVIPAMLQWQQGKPVLGRASHPVPWAYVAGDRSVLEVQDTLETMSLKPDAIRILPAFGRHNKSLIQTLVALSKMEPIPEFVVWEGFSDLCGERKPEVREFLSTMSTFCDPGPDFPNGLSILGIVESPKLKPYERYPNPRQRISGVSSWAYHSSTVLLIEEYAEDVAFETPFRTFWACLKNGDRLHRVAQFDSLGRLQVNSEDLNFS